MKRGQRARGTVGNSLIQADTPQVAYPCPHGIDKPFFCFICEPWRDEPCTN